MWPKTIDWAAVKAFLSGATLLHYSLPLIIIYLIAGTVAQASLGLYEATHIFFSSPVIWLADFIPLPGFPVLMSIMTLNLLCKLIWKSTWSLRYSGIILVHLSVFLLLVGGLMTALFAKEGYMELEPDRARAFVMDYHAREFVVETSAEQVLKRWPFETVVTGDVLSAPDFPFTIQILERCRHCAIEARDIGEDDPYKDVYQSMAKHMTLRDAPLKRMDEENMGGMVVVVRAQGGDDVLGVYALIEDVPKWPKIQVGTQSYTLKLQKEKRSLPFMVELLAFKRLSHPGTMMAKAYESRVRITDQAGSWESVIRMNEPLRYKGYTLFQSSFIQTDKGEISVLAVVENAGRSFPYLAGLVLCLGLILHLIVRRRL